MAESDNTRVVLERHETGPEGTFGQIYFDGQSLFTGELPDHGNAPNVSCIPADAYRVVWNFSPAFKRNMFLVADVEGRSGIRIHPANLMGDRAAGLKSHLYGCIALGRKLGTLHGQKAILVSRPAVSEFQNAMGRAPFALEIA